jgi:hypothetical protein
MPVKKQNPKKIRLSLECVLETGDIEQVNKYNRPKYVVIISRDFGLKIAFPQSQSYLF